MELERRRILYRRADIAPYNHCVRIFIILSGVGNFLPVIENKGVVSSEVAAAMADGVRRLTGSTFAVATTGLAEGSDGHYPEGTVWIGASGPEGTFTEIFQCQGPRKSNIKRFTTAALRFLEKNIVRYINNCK